MEFQEWGKIPRLTRECTITEKIDGTNAQVYFVDLRAVGGIDRGQLGVEFSDADMIATVSIAGIIHGAFAGSRTRWVTPENDNFGWAKWVLQNLDELAFGLGPGHHYGEWWGSGIQRGYNQKTKRFSLFNTHKWTDPDRRPACCDVVPVLYQGEFDTAVCGAAITALRISGSVAAPGFMKPEGIIVYHHAAGSYFKKTLEKDDKPKGSNE
jgi:hypothetical protein